MKEKKTMQKPELEFVRFDATDVIATSSPMNGIQGQAAGEGYGAVKALNFGGAIGGELPQ